MNSLFSIGDADTDAGVDVFRPGDKGEEGEIVFSFDGVLLFSSGFKKPRRICLFVACSFSSTKGSRMALIFWKRRLMRWEV